MPDASFLSPEKISITRKAYQELTTLQQFVKLLNDIERDIIYQDNPPEDWLSVKQMVFISKTASKRYHNFEIPKKNGGIREIKAPNGKLKRFQTAINVLFQIIFHERANYHSNGFLYNRNIIRNAQPHLNKKFLLNMDIENFFPSIEFGRIQAVLKLSPFNLVDNRDLIGFVITNMCCLEGKLPQGAPTSPILSTIVTQKLDRKISRFCNNIKVKYSRYADDLSFSSNKNIFDADFAKQIQSIIETEGLKINSGKTRIKSSAEHQEVTGIVVNKKINVRRKYIKIIRAVLKNWEEKGYDYAEKIFHNNEPHKSNYILRNVIEGRINHIGLIRGKHDPLYSKLLYRFRCLKYQINYDWISDINVRNKMKEDNIKMERILLDTVHNSEDRFIAFCTSAFHQIEHILYYFYSKRFPEIENLLTFIKERDSSFNHKPKQIKKIAIYQLLFLYESEFFFEKGISYTRGPRMLRDIRNDSSHRFISPEIESRLSTERKYQLLQIKWEKFRIETKTFPHKSKDEKDIEDAYRLIKFVDGKPYNRVRDILLEIMSNIKNYGIEM